MQAKRLIIAVRRWPGIVIGALWALQGLTGALGFNRDMQVLALPNVAPRAILPRNNIFKRAAAAAAGLALPILNLTGLLALPRHRRCSAPSIGASVPIVAAGAK